MKYSGIAWIGEIPDHWNVERLQWYLTEIKESNDPIQTEQILSLTNKRGVIPYEEKGAQGNNAKENVTDYKLAYPRTLVLNSMNVLIGSVGICDYFGCVSPVYYVFKPNEKANLEFINFIFQTEQFQKELRRYANGILEIRLRLSSAEILKRIVCFPSAETQARIVAHLNKKLAQIDALIANQEKQIEKLKQYKQALITEVVTKGLDPTVPMKDSGVEWIGKIPGTWETKPLKHLFSFGKGLPITKADLVENGVKVVSYGQIHAKYNLSAHLDEKLFRFVPNSICEANPFSLVNKGDFIFADTSEDVEGSGDFVYIDQIDRIYAGYHTITLFSKTNYNNQFLAYLFMSEMWKKQIWSKVCGVKVFSLSRSILSRTSVLLPPIEEQARICSFLDEKNRLFEREIAIKQSKIEKLNQYKKSLVYEYVTGKKEVV